MTERLKVYIETYGCQMNEYDSELVKSILADAGHSLAADEREAQVVLLNTCAVRENAHSTIYHRLQRLKATRAQTQRRVTVGPKGRLGCSRAADNGDRSHIIVTQHSA